MTRVSRIAAVLSYVKLARSARSFLLSAGAGATILLLAPESVRAAFHAWEIAEVYSSADGSVQFVEMRALGGGQQFVNGQSVRSTNSTGTHTFTFPSSLPTNSLDRSCIIGTANLASIPGGVIPDFILPANFIQPPIAGGNAAVIYNASGSTIAYTNLPTDGDFSLTRSGGSVILAINSPKNFNDESNSVVPVKLKTISQSGIDFILSFATATGTNGTAGPNYGVEFNDTFNIATWQVLTNVSGDGTVKTVTNVNASDPQRFYRLRVP